VLRSIFQMETVQADLLIGADGINSVVRQGIIGDGFLTMQNVLAGARSIFSRAIVSQRNNCNNVIQWSKFHADGWGMVIPLGYKCIIGRRLCQSTGNRC